MPTRKPPMRADGSPKVPGSSKKWSRRFVRRSSAGRGDGGAGEGRGDSDAIEVHPHGPLQSRPDEPRRADEKAANASNWDDADNVSSSYAPPPSPPQLPRGTAGNNGDGDGRVAIDDIIDRDLITSASSSSNKAVLAFASSTDTPAGNSASRGVGSPPSPTPHSPSRRPPTSPSSPSRQQRPRSSSNALETSKDRDDAYGAWWFLTSISESFDTAQSNASGRRTPLGMRTNIVSRQSYNRSPTAGIPKQYEDAEDSSQSMGAGNGAAFELPPWKQSRSSSPLRVPLEGQQRQSYPPEQPTGGEYTAKEQRIRKDWLAGGDALGGTLNYDAADTESSSASPYYYVPAQQATIQPSRGKSLDWHKVTGKTKSEETETVMWTPQDSSYGAAVPAFGWVPKPIRKLLEGVFVVLIMALLIFVMVKVGIMLKSSGSGGGEDIYFGDDDHYIAFNDDDGSSNDSNDSGSSGD